MAYKLSVKKVAEALMKHHGVLSQAAEACGCSRRALYVFIEKNPELEEVRAEARDGIMDVAENHIHTAVKIGDMKTVRWFAERMGKDRGYVTRVEETGKDGAPMEFSAITRNVVDPKEDTKDDVDDGS